MKAIKHLTLAIAVAFSGHAVSESYYDSAYESISRDSFADLNKHLPQYVGYESQDRISKGAADNPLEMEAKMMENDASKAFSSHQGRAREGTLQSMANKVTIQLHNYEEAKALNELAEDWDHNRRDEILGAQAYRAQLGMDCNQDENRTQYDRYMCQYPSLTADEQAELLAIDERIEERDKFQRLTAVPDDLTERRLADAEEFKDENGIVQDPMAYAEKTKNKYFGTVIGATAAFCMMDISAARADETGDCKRAICKVFGKLVCKKVF